MTVLSECLGSHWIAELSGCDADALASAAVAQPILKRAVEECGATPIRYVVHQFDPQGFTAVAVLAESHISLHSWPEKAYLAVDIFTCGTTMDPRVAIEVLQDGFSAPKVDLRVVRRGIPS